MGESRRSKSDVAASSEEPKLARLRQEIDEVDCAILEKLNERAKLVLEIGRLKQSQRASVYEEAREKKIVRGLVERNPGPFPAQGLGPVFREIISATRSLEEGVQIAFMGPEGTFSHQAARLRFGRLAQLEPMRTIRDVFAAVEKGAASLGVVPVENSTEGVVTQTLDTFVDSDVLICGEMLLRISVQLASKSGRLEDVQRVISNPQPLAQCRDWLELNLPGVERLETTSTTTAAQRAAEDGSLAAICSGTAAETNGLRAIESAIEDRRDNTTRFLVIGKETPAPTDNDLTSVVFTIRKDSPGGLYRLLRPFADVGLNLTSIHLRPIRGKPWEYLFFIDFEGHCTNPRVVKALKNAATISHSHRVLGSFPKAELERGQL
jgi:chorismate mutase/prephenate dehydratase